jgi:hypothetical protein
VHCAATCDERVSGHVVPFDPYALLSKLADFDVDSKNVIYCVWLKYNFFRSVKGIKYGTY